MPLPHENLVAWQRAEDLFIDLHRLTHQRLPRFERFELSQQVLRATEEESAIYQQRLSAIGGPLQGLINKRKLEIGVTGLGSVLIAFLALCEALM